MTVQRSLTPVAAVPVIVKKANRVVELDILRGFLLLWMALTHLPTWASNISNQTFGFVSGAEGFIFLAAFMVGQIQFRAQQKGGEKGASRDLIKRITRVYLYHCGLLVVAFTIIALIGVKFHREPLQNLLSFYLQSPKQAIIAALLLWYRPSLLDILPMYVVFMAITPLARRMAARWSWEPVIYLSFLVWACAQFGLRAWFYRHTNFFGLEVPENSTGAFDTWGWQLLWIVGLALGTIYAESLASDEIKSISLPRWLLGVSMVVAGTLFVLRYAPTDKWIDSTVYGWLIDKWHLGPVRILNFSALAIILSRFGPRIASIPILPSLAVWGRASIEVFTVHVLCCLGADALSHQADPNLPWWQQIVVLIVTIAACSATAQAVQTWKSRHRPPTAA